MAVQLNHTIVNVPDKRASATFLAEILGLPTPTSFGPFLVVELANGVSLDFADEHGAARSQHYAFLVTEKEFDQIFGRITNRGLAYWADPGRRRAGELNRNDGGRGVDWEEPGGHFLEVITRARTAVARDGTRSPATAGTPVGATRSAGLISAWRCPPEPRWPGSAAWS